MPGSNQDGLISFKERTEQEQRDIARSGGVASGIARRRKKNLREIAKAMLEAEMPDDDKVRRKLEELGFEGTFGSAMMMAQLEKANRGDTEAARFVRDTSGQRPQETLGISVTEQPFEALDFSLLTDAQLAELASYRGE